jgi:hypothetical protein
MEPRIIEFPVYPDPTGWLAVADEIDLPFEVKRVFWVYDIIGERGDHALKTCHQLIIPLSGMITIHTIHENIGNCMVYALHKKHVGLYLPPMVWRNINGKSGSSFFVLASHPFDEDDYIDGVDDFLKALVTSEMEKGLKFSDEETN